MTDSEKIKSIIDKAKNLVAKNVSAYDPDFQAWKTSAERFLIKKFGNDSYEHINFKQIYFTPVFVTAETPDSLLVECCRDGLNQSIKTFQDYQDEINEESEISNNNLDGSLDKTRIFIVHGHDGELKQAIARIIEKQGIEPIILSEQANLGLTIIEKLERYGNVGGAICLFTSDDKGKGNSEKGYKSRARQNVVLETGYFWGKLGRKNIVIVSDNSIEMPSDLDGVVYSNNRNWEIDLLKDLNAMGYSIDMNKLP